MKRAWDVQVASNWWLSLGVHVDHTDPSLTLHLPGVIVYAGHCKQPGFRHTLPGYGGCVSRAEHEDAKRDAWKIGHSYGQAVCETERDAALAEVTRLREALGQIAESGDWWRPSAGRYESRALRALAEGSDVLPTGGAEPNE